METRNHYRSSMAVLAFVLAAGVFTACGAAKHPATSTLSVEGKTAVYGRQVVAAVRSAADGVDAMIKTKALAQDDGVKVLLVLREFGPQTKNLAAALQTIDEAKDATARASGIAEATLIVRAMQRGVTMAVVPVGAETQRVKVAAVLAVISDALSNLSIAIIQKDAALFEPNAAWPGRPKQGILATIAVPWPFALQHSYGAW